MTERERAPADSVPYSPPHAGGHVYRALTALIPLIAITAFVAGCKSAPRNMDAVVAYYRYDFAAARQALRGDAMLRNDEQTILNNTRLGMAALADGDLREAEHTLGRSFDLLSTAGLNKDRTIAAVIDHEGVKIWKGEPFEQALTYHYVSALYALRGDWENMRAAAANSLFRLTDFGQDQDSEKLARRAAKEQDYLERGYTAVDTDFALGFLMQAIGSDLSDAGGADAQLDAAVKINGDLAPLAEKLRSRDFDTLLIVDYGKGPTKIAYGPDGALVRFAPQDGRDGNRPLIASADGQQIASVNPVCDVDRMAVDHRWNNLEDVRRAKSMIGDVLVFGGAIATMHGSRRRDGGTALAGLGAIAAGLLSKSGARGDTRYCEFMPHAIYLVPLKLGRTADVRVSIGGQEAGSMFLPQVEPGAAGSPRVMYLRLLGPDSPQPAWLAAQQLVHGNDHAGPSAGAGPRDYPWILGGNDISTPSAETLRAYHAAGFLLDVRHEDDLKALYDAEGILIGSGMENRPKQPRNPSFQHVLEGGTGLFTPQSHSMGYKRLMFSKHAHYDAKSVQARNAAAAMRVMQEQALTAGEGDVEGAEQGE